VEFQHKKELPLICYKKTGCKWVFAAFKNGRFGSSNDLWEIVTKCCGRLTNLPLKKGGFPRGPVLVLKTKFGFEKRR
jgi:hypothetical protein